MNLMMSPLWFLRGKIKEKPKLGKGPKCNKKKGLRSFLNEKGVKYPIAPITKNGCY